MNQLSSFQSFTLKIVLLFTILFLSILYSKSKEDRGLGEVSSETLGKSEQVLIVEVTEK